MFKGVPSAAHQASEKLETLLAIGQAREGDKNMANNVIDLFAVNPHAAFYY